LRSGLLAKLVDMLKNRFSIVLKTNRLQKVFQKVPFCVVKGHLLHIKRASFTM